jgi:hypothetical protein
MAVDSSIDHGGLEGIDVIFSLVIDYAWEALLQTEQGCAFLLVLHCFVVAMAYLLIAAYGLLNAVVALSVRMVSIVL